MPDTRYTLLGKLCVWAVRATDDQLRSALRKGGWKGLAITKRKSKRRGRRILKRTYATIKLKRKKKPTAKQIKARKLFAMRAKRGDFRR